jgi:hypothetical protein
LFSIVEDAKEELDRIAGPTLDALEMMHGESFLHRDIAPTTSSCALGRLE